MSLDYRLGGIKNHKTVCWETVPKGYQQGYMDSVLCDDKGKITHRMKPETSALIWVCLSIGMGEITEKTVEEFAVRLSLWQDVHGPLLCTDKKGIRVTTEDVYRHMGLSTNVGKEPWTKFLKRLRVRAERVVASELKKIREKGKATKQAVTA